MDSSISPIDEIWFLRVCHHISNAVYQQLFHCGVFPNATVAFFGRCGGRAAVASGCATGNNPPAGAREWRKNRPAPVFVLLPVVICVTAVPNGSRMDTTHFAELRRMFKSSF
jgi:hypothetical protein